MTDAPRLITADRKTYPLKSPCEIGRTEDCAIALEDPQVSRRHCLLQADSRHCWWITDQESTNGTYLNGRRLTQATQLRNGDCILVGSHEFFFYGESQPRKVASPTVKEGTTIQFSQNNCWLLIGDIIGSTTLAQEEQPEAIGKVVGEWGYRCRDIIEQHRGEVNKFLGDGYFAFWREGFIEGAEMAQVLAELLALRESMGLAFRLVLHFGQVQLGGMMTRGEENLSGSAVNFVFKAEKVASSLGEPLFVSAAAAQYMSDATLKELGTHGVPGFPGESAFFTLKSSV